MTGGSNRLRRAFVALLVLFVVAQPLVGTAAAAGSTASSAQTTAPDCDESWTGTALSIVSPAYNIYNSHFADEDCVPGDRVRGQTVVDVYESGLHVKDTQSHISTAQSNHIQDSRSYAWTLVQSEAVNALKNGSNLSVAQDNVNESLREYYSTIQANNINAYQSTIHDLLYLGHQAEDSNVPYAILASTGGYHDNPEPYTAFSAWGPEAMSDSSGDQITPYQRNITLIDGSERPYTFAILYSDYSGGVKIRGFLDPFNMTLPENGAQLPYVDFNNGSQNGTETVSYDSDNSYMTSTANRSFSIIVREPDAYVQDHLLDSPYEVSEVFNETEWNKMNSDTVDAYDQMQANAMNYTADLYAQYNGTDFDSLEVLDANTLATQYGTDYNSTGYYGWQTAEAGLLGLNVTINDSFSIHYTPAEETCTYSATSNTTANETCFVNDRNMSGVLYTDWSPSSTNGSFEVGATYNTTNANVPVYFVNQTANGTESTELVGEFTINSLTNVRTGESINSTTLQEQNRATSNVSLTAEQLEQLVSLRDNVTASYGGSGGGGGGGFNWDGLSIGGAAISGLVALGIALVVLGNGNPLSRS